MDDPYGTKAMNKALGEVNILLGDRSSSSADIRTAILVLLEHSNEVRRIAEGPQTQGGEFLIIDAIRRFQARDPEAAIKLLSDIMDNPENIEGRPSLSKIWSEDITNLPLQQRAELFPHVLDVFNRTTQPGLKAAAGHQVVALSFYHDNTAEIGHALRSVFDYATETKDRVLAGEATAKRKSLWAQLQSLQKPLEQGDSPPPAQPI